MNNEIFADGDHLYIPERRPTIQEAINICHSVIEKAMIASNISNKFPLGGHVGSDSHVNDAKEYIFTPRKKPCPTKEMFLQFDKNKHIKK